MKIKVRKLDGKVVAFGHCDFSGELGVSYEQFTVTDQEVAENNLRMVDVYDITRTGSGTYTVTLKT